MTEHDLHFWCCEQDDWWTQKFLELLHPYQAITAQRWKARQKTNKREYRSLLAQTGYLQRPLKVHLQDHLSNQRLSVHPDVLNLFLVELGQRGFSSPVH